MRRVKTGGPARETPPQEHRRNRVDPWGDLHSVATRGLFTGNRGCLVNQDGKVVRHHAGNVWIICKLEFRGWRWPLARPHRWTPLFFLDDAVALAAGHRPCATCRRPEYLAYRDAVGLASGRTTPLRAWELNDRLRDERLRHGRGIERGPRRLTWRAPLGELPDGSVIIDDREIPLLVFGSGLLRFDFVGWGSPSPLGDRDRRVTVLTPPTSVAALTHGFQPMLHPSAAGCVVHAGRAGGRQPGRGRVNQL